MIDSDSEASSPSSQRRFSWLAIAIGTALSLAICGGVTARAVTVGWPDGGWFYPYTQSPSLAMLAVWLFYGVGAAAILVSPWPPSERRPWSTLVAWIAVATALQWILRTMAPYPLEALLVSDNANSFYSVAQKYDAGEILSQFSRVRYNAPLHVQSNMPGKLLLTDALQLVTTRTGLLPWLVIGLSNLGALLMFGFVRDLFDSRRAALFAAALYLFLPARTFFFPLMNTATPVIVIGCAWLLLRWLQTGRTLHAALLGIALYALVLFEPLPLVMGLLFLALAVAAILRREIAGDRFIAQASVTVFALIGTSEAMSAWVDFDIVRTFHIVGRHAMEFNETTGRPYGAWIFANLWEFAFGLGFCQVVLFVVTLVAGLRAPGGWRERLSRPVTAVCIGLVAVLGAVDLIGVNRGEVTRLWIFLGCFYQIPAAWVCSMLSSRLAIALVVGISAFHAAIGVTLIRFVMP